MIELLAQTSLNAIYAASYISLIAVGLVLIFGVMGVINFAHGELYMAGAYAIVLLYTDFQLPFIAAVGAGLAFAGCLGLVMERAMFRPLRDNPLGGLVASIGFLMILQALAAMGFGVRMEHIPPVTTHVLEFSDRVRLPLSRLFVIVAAIVLLAALWIFLKKTRLGWALARSRPGSRGGRASGHIHQPHGAARDVHRRCAGGRGRRAHRAAGLGQSPYGAFGDRHRVHRNHRRRRRQPWRELSSHPSPTPSCTPSSPPSRTG